MTFSGGITLDGIMPVLPHNKNIFKLTKEREKYLYKWGQDSTDYWQAHQNYKTNQKISKNCEHEY